MDFDIGLKRCRKSCRLRWLNYLKPNIKKGDFSEDEVDLMIKLHNLLGNRFAVFFVLKIYVILLVKIQHVANLDIKLLCLGRVATNPIWFC